MLCRSIYLSEGGIAAEWETWGAPGLPVVQYRDPYEEACDTLRYVVEQPITEAAGWCVGPPVAAPGLVGMALREVRTRGPVEPGLYSSSAESEQVELDENQSSRGGRLLPSEALSSS